MMITFKYGPTVWSRTKLFFSYDSSLVSHRQLHPGGKMEEYQEDIFVSWFKYLFTWLLWEYMLTVSVVGLEYIL